ncbi:C-type lectin domain-containing protein [Gammaproteobacteria bacterium]
MLKEAAVVSSLAVFFVNPAQADSAKLLNPANGHAYQLFDTAVYWQTAKNSCASLGGHLATITSQAENDWIQSNFGTEVWLGGTDEAQEGTWKWITGEEWSYTNWQSGEPNDSCGGEDYLEMNFPGHGPSTWNDYGGPGCYSINLVAYLCEWENNNQYLDVAVMPDVTGDGIQDQAVLSTDSGKYYLRTINGATGKQIKQVTLGVVADIKAIALSSGEKQISVLITKVAGGAESLNVVQLRNNVTLALQKTITLPK